jgi:hypothetical protein
VSWLDLHTDCIKTSKIIEEEGVDLQIPFHQPLKFGSHFVTKTSADFGQRLNISDSWTEGTNEP